MDRLDTSCDFRSMFEGILQKNPSNNAYHMDHSDSTANPHNNSIWDAVDEAVADEIAVVDQSETVDEPDGGG